MSSMPYPDASADASARLESMVLPPPSIALAQQAAEQGSLNRLPVLCRCVNRGFTLLELLVVMVIIGLLASFVAPRYFQHVAKAESRAARAQLDAFDKALTAYRLDTGHVPTTEQALKALLERPANEPKWSGPYLAKALPPDPWGRPYFYRTPGEQGRDYDLMSFGKDGQRGGVDENADISVWDAGR